jgi:hypothetical protein
MQLACIAATVPCAMVIAAASSSPVAAIASVASAVASTDVTSTSALRAWVRTVRDA